MSNILQSECCQAGPSEDAVYDTKNGIVGVCPKCQTMATFVPPEVPASKSSVYYGRTSLGPAGYSSWVQRMR